MAVAYCSHASLFLILLLASVSTAPAIELDGGRRKPPPAAPRTPPPPPGLGVFDYYILAIQWPISFCKDVKLQSDKCKVPAGTKLPQIFTIHGLWPSKSVGEPVRSGEVFDVQQIASSFSKMKDDWPSAKFFVKAPIVLTYKSFWAYEWREHGAESGLSQKEFFQLAISLYEEAKKVIDPYFARRAGANIDIGSMKAAFNNLGVPEAICNVGPNIQRQLVELRFNVSKTGDFQNHTGTRNPDPKNACLRTVYLPAN